MTLVATTTLSVHARAVRSTVTKKITMAITGLILVGFLLVHMFGNLKMFVGEADFNHYAEWLKQDLLYPFMPKGWFIWIFRALLLVAIGLHIWAAASLTVKDRQANGRQRGAGKPVRKAQTYAARTMRWGGVILAGFLVFHILQFTARLVTTGFSATEPSAYKMVVASFSLWPVTLAYAIWMVTVCMHIRHGFWSAFTTLGANVSAKSRRLLNALAIVLAVLLYVGFMIMPIAVLAGMVK
ncbi:MAG TPA: succinate dehydrogenase cytochrome b subunit [Propionibacteriaceae bacterium]|nr:succinate dehydrogenase cytochrome b subunit [Propionibacteriaceae bacterium]